MIPVIVVPVLNRPELVHALLNSIDHPVDRVVIIDNGDVIDPLIGGRNMYPFTVRVIAPGHNLGVAASWNLGMKANPLAPWWLIVNSDIEFGPGDLARLEATVEPRANAVYYMLGMTSFAVTVPALQTIGFFDEQITPAYDEDLDWQRRLRLAGVLEVEAGFSGSHVGSATIYADPVLRQYNGRTHAANDVYYAEKWGGPKQGGETFDTPFNRGGHLGDWRLDIQRLRDQAWPKRTS
jgi:GT2 family glycosyltransferase